MSRQNHLYLCPRRTGHYKRSVRCATTGFLEVPQNTAEILLEVMRAYFREIMICPQPVANDLSGGSLVKRALGAFNFAKIEATTKRPELLEIRLCDRGYSTRIHSSREVRRHGNVRKKLSLHCGLEFV